MEEVWMIRREEDWLEKKKAFEDFKSFIIMSYKTKQRRLNYFPTQISDLFEDRHSRKVT